MTEQKERPAILYKYRALNPYTDRLLSNGEIFCCPPTDFNDPFECRPMLYFDLEDPSSDAWIKEEIKRRGIKDPSKRFEILRRFRRTWGEPRAVGEAGYPAKWVQEVGIYSLTSKCNDLLMWAHYADDHKGLCVGFDTELWPFCTSMDVTYSKNYPVINRAATTPGETLTKAVLTKAECWGYEDEWRIVMRRVGEDERSRYAGRTDKIAQWTVSQRGPGTYTVPPEAIVRIILGSRMSDEYKNRLAAKLRARPRPVSLFEARLNRSEFQIDIVPYSPTAR